MPDGVVVLVPPAVVADVAFILGFLFEEWLFGRERQINDGC